MRRTTVLAASLLAFLCIVTLVLTGQAAEKPKDAPTLDDRTGTLTETVDGKEKTTKLELKHGLKVKGYFSKDGFTLEELDNEGPAANLMDSDGNRAASAEPGDVIVELDGAKIQSAKDYAKALNDAKDPNKIKLKIKDINSGQDQEFYLAAVKR